jgi:hypothetical protein
MNLTESSFQECFREFCSSKILAELGECPRAVATVNKTFFSFLTGLRNESVSSSRTLRCRILQVVTSEHGFVFNQEPKPILKEM